MCGRAKRVTILIVTLIEPQPTGFCIGKMRDPISANTQGLLSEIKKSCAGTRPIHCAVQKTRSLAEPRVANLIVTLRDPHLTGL